MMTWTHLGLVFRPVHFQAYATCWTAMSCSLDIIVVQCQVDDVNCACRRLGLAGICQV